MSNPLPIVSLAGDNVLHARAESYNRKLGALRDAMDDLEDAHEWNRRERFGTGFFAQTKPPVPTSFISQTTESLRAELVRERAEIVALASGTLKP
jgi:hypothetical protein